MNLCQSYCGPAQSTFGWIALVFRGGVEKVVCMNQLEIRYRFILILPHRSFREDWTRRYWQVCGAGCALCSSGNIWEVLPKAVVFSSFQFDSNFRIHWVESLQTFLQDFYQSQHHMHRPCTCKGPHQAWLWVAQAVDDDLQKYVASWWEIVCRTDFQQFWPRIKTVHCSDWFFQECQSTAYCYVRLTVLQRNRRTVRLDCQWIQMLKAFSGSLWWVRWCFILCGSVSVCLRRNFVSFFLDKIH